MAKVAVIAYLATIHGPSYARLKRAFIWIASIIQIAAVLVLIIVIFLQCQPVARLWNESLPGSCTGRLRNENYAYFQACKLYFISCSTGEDQTLIYIGLGAFYDIMLAVYPIFLFWNLKMAMAKKVVLCVLFSFGVV